MNSTNPMCPEIVVHVCSCIVSLSMYQCCIIIMTYAIIIVIELYSYDFVFIMLGIIMSFFIESEILISWLIIIIKRVGFDLYMHGFRFCSCIHDCSNYGSHLRLSSSPFNSLGVASTE